VAPNDSDEAETPQFLGDDLSEVQRVRWYHAILDCIPLFSKKRKRVRALASAKQSCEKALVLLEKKEKDLENKRDRYETFTLAAINAKKINDAVKFLKRKKFYTNQLEKIQIHKFNIETQIAGLEENHTNRDMFETMSNVSRALKKAGGNAQPIEQIEDTVESLHDLLQEVSDCSQALREEISYPEDNDEDLRQEILDAMGTTPNLPPSPPVIHALRVGSAPKPEPIKTPSEEMEEINIFPDVPKVTPVAVKKNMLGI
jgi:hypothetical protein